jgi:hypothetical protein
MACRARALRAATLARRHAIMVDSLPFDRSSTWLGHVSAELTLNLYGHHMGTDSDRAGIARLNQVLGEGRRTRKRSAETDDSDAGDSAT